MMRAVILAVAMAGSAAGAQDLTQTGFDLFEDCAEAASSGTALAADFGSGTDVTVEMGADYACKVKTGTFDEEQARVGMTAFQSRVASRFRAACSWPEQDADSAVVKLACYSAAIKHPDGARYSFSMDIWFEPGAELVWDVQPVRVIDPDGTTRILGFNRDG